MDLYPLAPLFKKSPHHPAPRVCVGCRISEKAVSHSRLQGSRAINMNEKCNISDISNNHFATVGSKKYYYKVVKSACTDTSEELVA